MDKQKLDRFKNWFEINNKPLFLTLGWSREV